MYKLKTYLYLFAKVAPARLNFARVYFDDLSSRKTLFKLWRFFQIEKKQRLLA